MGTDYLKLCKNGYRALQEMKADELEYMTFQYSLTQVVQGKLSKEERKEFIEWAKWQDKIRKNEGLF